MKTKTIFNFLAFAMLMAAMVLTTACSGSDDLADNKPETTEPTEPVAKKGYELPVTINVTRQGDDATRASYDENTGILSFSTGDKLFVNGAHGDAGLFGGTLTYDGGTTFSGTITTKNAYSGTADALFSSAQTVAARLLPNDYGTYEYFSVTENDGYNASLYCNKGNAFATTKALAVEQFCNEWAGSYYNGFQLTPLNAILNFTIYPLTATGNVTISFTGINDVSINKEVTVDDDGKVTFAIGVDGYTNLNQYALTVGGNTIYLGSHALAAGKIYNITRYANTISGKFSVSATKQVNFSKGNLRYASGTWSFFDNQYDYYTSYSADAWDKFGWSTSSTTYGMSTSSDLSDYSGDFVDWGATMGTGWFTLSSAEWTYLFNTRSASNGRYAKAKVNNVQGVILFPDTYTHPDGVTAPTGVNATDDTGWNGNNYSSADWTKMESAGCVFLPAAGDRYGSSVRYVGSYGNYWSSTALNTLSAYYVYFSSGGLSANEYYSRSSGYSVRLVREVE